MSKDAAVKFIDAIDKSPKLKEQIRSQGLEQDQTPENRKKLLDLAAKEGYQFTTEELTAAAKERAQQRMKAGEISEEDLEKVAGGRGCSFTCLFTCLVTA
jgi:predicted ribosomally synthesized peptide with nif11-like leader